MGPQAYDPMGRAAAFRVAQPAPAAEAVKSPEGAAVQEAVEQMVREAEAMQREQASRIVVPGRGNTPDIKLV